MRQQWFGLECERFEFEEKVALLVFPDKNVKPLGKIVFKTLYWGSFPDVEINLAKRGYHVACIQTLNRFGVDEDCHRKARYIKFLAKEYGLSEKCALVGMSLGGAHAVRFAGFYPELVSCIWLDAPVLNLHSYPGKFGNAECEGVWEKEFVNAYPGVKRYQLHNMDIHPINKADILVENKIPVLLSWGTEDCSVNFNENGRLLIEAYKDTGLLKALPVGLRGHHPHGKIDNNAEIIDWIAEHA